MFTVLPDNFLKGLIVFVSLEKINKHILFFLFKPFTVLSLFIISKHGKSWHFFLSLVQKLLLFSLTVPLLFLFIFKKFSNTSFQNTSLGMKCSKGGPGCADSDKWDFLVCSPYT